MKTFKDRYVNVDNVTVLITEDMINQYRSNGIHPLTQWVKQVNTGKHDVCQHLDKEEQAPAYIDTDFSQASLIAPSEYLYYPIPQNAQEWSQTSARLMEPITFELELKMTYHR